MKKTAALPYLIVIAILGAAAVALSTLQTPAAPPSSADRPVVAATVFPIFDIARNVAGDAVDVRLILPVGASPHTFEPSPSTLRLLADAEAVYVVGYGLDGWASDLTDETATEIIEVHDGIAPRTFGEDEGHEEEEDHEEEDTDHEEDEGDHAHEGADPHYWLDVANAKLIAENIAKDLAIRHPELAERIATNLDVYLSELDRTDAEIRAILAEAASARLVTLHDAWYYFADAYGLEIVATFEPSPGREPTPRYLAELGRAVQEAGTSVIYTEPQISTATLAPFLRDHDLEVATLDPLGTDINGSYTELMRANARTIRDHQR